MSNIDQAIAELTEAGALKQGHFILSSGLHSEFYVQCAEIFSNPKIADELCKKLADKVRKNVNMDEIDYVVSPAMGGVLIGYEMARQLGKKNFFLERVDGKFELRRGFRLKAGDKVLVVEDVVTTGKSSKEAFETIKSFGAEIIAEASLINRSKSEDPLDGVPLTSLYEFPIETFDENNVPDHLRDMPAVKPGSRFLA